MKCERTQRGSNETTVTFTQKDIIEALVLYTRKVLPKEASTPIFTSYYKSNDDTYTPIESEFVVSNDELVATLMVEEYFVRDMNEENEKQKIEIEAEQKAPKKKAKKAKKVKKSKGITIKQKVYNSVSTGFHRFREIMNHTKLSKTQVANALYQLKQDGSVMGDGKGYWELAEPH